MDRFMDKEVDATLHQILLCPKGELDYLFSSNKSSLDTLLQIYEMLQEYNNGTSSDSLSVYQQAEYILYSVVVVAICIIGIIGNCLNLAILSHRSWQMALGRMERFSHSGLIGLAASDLSFCLFVLPHSFVDQHKLGYDTLGFHVIYVAYKSAVIHTSILCSTMLTVALAIGRYFAIVYPIKAREVVGMTLTRRVICGVLLFSILANLPRYWLKTVTTTTCFVDGTNHYFVQNGPVQNYDKIYFVIYFIIAICAPFTVLTFCNVYLLKELKQSIKATIQCRANERSKDSSFRITLSLVIIIIAFLVLVVPGDLITFFKDVILSDWKEGNSDKYNLPLAVLSCMQAINFSFNFILYCAVNTHFRRTFKNMMRCDWSNIAQRKHGSYRYDSVSMGSNTLRMSITMATKGQIISSIDNADSVIKANRFEV